MSNYRISLTVGGINDTAEIEADSPEQALFLTGASLGAAMVVGQPNAAMLASVMGIGMVQESVEETLREESSGLTIEEI